MTHFNRYSKNEASAFTFDDLSDIEFTVDDIVKNENKTKYGEAVTAIKPSSYDMTENWALI